MVVITLPITFLVSVFMVPRAVDTALAEFPQFVLELVSTSSFVFFIFDQMEGIVLSVLFFIPAIAVLTAALAIPKPVLDFEEMDFLDDEDDIDMDDEPLPFSPSSDFDNADSDASTSSKERSAIDDALDLIAPFTQAIAQAKKEAMRKKKENRSSVQDCQYYSFQNFSQAAQLGAFLAPFFEGESSLYKDSFSNNYYMILRKTQSENDTFHRACNIAADFGVRISASYATPAYFREHFETILEENAVEMLGELA